MRMRKSEPIKISEQRAADNWISKIPKADSMDGTIGDIFNKEVNDSNHSRCVHVKLLFQFQFMNPHGFGCLHIGYRAVLKFELLKVQ